MTQPLQDHSRPKRSPTQREAAEVSRIAAELAALGEDPADDDELELVRTAAVDADANVRTVATLVELSGWVAPADGLLPLERHRVWQRIAKQTAATRTTPAARPTELEHTGSSANGFTTWRGVVVSLSLVASVTMLLRVDVAPPPSAEDRAALESMGEATRAVLEGTLPGEQDGSRARAFADGYAERLQAARGAER